MAIIDGCDGECQPRVGVYALTSCYGCQLKLATVQKIMEIANAVSFESFYMLSSASKHPADVDVAFVEGSVSTEKDLEELYEIRKHSRILVALGACSVNGGVQSWAEGEMTHEELHAKVYGTGKIGMKGLQATPISKHVEVDYYLPGCPPEEDEIMYFISAFLFGTFPEPKDYPVCSECRLAGNPCILIERGEPCLGPVTTAGCKARCITFNVPCIGCRGPVPHDTAWFDSLAMTFKNKGISKDQVRERFRIFGAHNPNLEPMLKKIYGGTD
ncbi:sulfhydrogenase 1 subunit delta [Candidatus Thorarchaeota archaeon]|nr:MAG: sulfhydrogenase 1 subunit delta [Candidatus Thorarchaeota archaeon]